MSNKNRENIYFNYIKVYKTFKDILSYRREMFYMSQSRKRSIPTKIRKVVFYPRNQKMSMFVMVSSYANQRLFHIPDLDKEFFDRVSKDYFNSDIYCINCEEQIECALFFSTHVLFIDKMPIFGTQVCKIRKHDVRVEIAPELTICYEDLYTSVGEIKSISKNRYSKTRS